MRRHLLLFFSGLFLIISCTDNKTSGDIIEKDKMVQILCDLHIIDGTMAAYGPKDSLYKYGTNRYGLLFKKYGVDSASFNKSVKYYSATPDKIIAIYEQVEALLKIKSDSIEKVQAKLLELANKRMEAKNNAERKRKADSISRDSIKKAKKAIQLKLNKEIK